CLFTAVLASCFCIPLFFFFSSRRRHTRSKRDWSSDVCSSDLIRFVYPAPNCCWQLDATEVAISGGRTAVVLQLIDDHSRLALATLAAHAETSAAAMQVTKTASARHRVPQRLLSHHSAATNPTRPRPSRPLA